jgi:succinate dehydrogenase / fumarate reductase flavoprotein subunit
MAIADYVKHADLIALPADPSGEVEAELKRIRESSGKSRPGELRAKMQKDMMDYVGVFREAAGMQKALDSVRELKERFYTDLTIDDKGYQFNTDLLEAWELGCLLDIAEITTISALTRTESRGAHSREDYKDRDDVNWLVHTLITRRPDSPVFMKEPDDAEINLNKKVNMSLAEVDERFAPKVRTY